MKDYIIPIGVNAENLINPLSETISKMEQASDTAKKSGKVIEQAFSDAGKSATVIDEKIKPITKSLDAVKLLGKQAGKELADAFADRNIDPSRLEKAIGGFKDKLSGLSKIVDINISDEQLLIAEKQLANTKNEFEELGVAINIAKNIMDNLDPNSEEFKQLEEGVTFVETAFKEMGDEMARTGTKSKTLKQELRGIKEELAQMELNGEAGSERFRNLSRRAGELTDQIGDTNAQIKALASDTGKFDGLISGVQGLTGGFVAVQGASALFGDESEDLQKALLKVNGAMAVLQGLQQVSETLNKDSAFSVIFLSKARNTETIATIAQTEAQTAHALVVGAEAIAVEALAVAEAQLTSATVAVTVASEAHAVANTEETLAMLSSAQSAEIEALALRQTALAEVQTAQSAVANSSAQLAQAGSMGAVSVASKVLKFALASIGIGLIIIAVAYLIEYWDELKDAINDVLPAGESLSKMFDKVKSIAFGVGNALVQYVIAPIKAIYYATQGEFKKSLDALASGYDVIGNFKSEKNKQDLRNNEKYLDEKAQQNITDEKRDLERRKARGENVYNLEKKNLERQIALNKKTGAKNEDLQKELEDNEDRHYKELADKRSADSKKAQEDAKKRAEERAKAQEEARNKAIEEAKKNADLTKRFAEENLKIEVEAMEDGIKKTLKLIDLETKNKRDAIMEQGATSAKAIEARDKLIAGIEAEGKRKKTEAQKKYDEEAVKLKLDGSKLLEELSKDSLKKDLNLLNFENQAKIADINEKYKNETDLRDKLIDAQNSYFDKKRMDAINKRTADELKEEEEKLILTAELVALYAGDSITVEEQKQLAILQIKKDYAQKNLDALLSGGADENSIEVLKAKKILEETSNALDLGKKDGKKFDFFEFIGLDITGEEGKSIADAGKKLLDNVRGITDGLLDMYQQQIDKKQEVIDQIDNEIADLENRLDEEKDLKDQGFANDYELIQAQLSAKQAQKDEEIRQQEELIKKQQAIQKAQMAIDTAVQLSNMVTSATEIFKVLSGIPFIGIPLAIATIGTMFGAFALAKSNAYNAIGSGQKFRKGGGIDGASHENGGVKYYSEDGRNIELEGGEFVFRKDARSKYRGLLEAMNAGNFSGLSLADVGVKALFSDLGIDLSTDSIGEAVDGSNRLKGLENGLNINLKSGDDFRRMDENIDFLAKKKRDQIETWEDQNYYYTKVGTKVTKRPKKQKNEY